MLNGGTVVAALDAFSVAAQMTAPQPNPMMGRQPPPPTTSTLPTLLSAWGVTFESGQVLADPTLATKPAATASASPSSPSARTPCRRKDNVITKDLGSVTFFLPGAFTKTGGGGVTANTLIKSTTQAGFVDAMRASQLDPALARTLKPNGTAYDLVTHLSGTFKTAFPNGKPESRRPKKPKAPDAKDAPKEEPKPDSLKEGIAPGNVFLIADVDAFYDRFAYNIQNFGGQQMATPANGNATLLFNMLDQAAGSKHLIGSRSRAAVRRPFTVVQKMEADFNKTVGAKIEEFQDKQKAAQQKLSELQAQKSRGSELSSRPPRRPKSKNSARSRSSIPSSSASRKRTSAARRTSSPAKSPCSTSPPCPPWSSSSDSASSSSAAVPPAPADFKSQISNLKFLPP